MASIHVIDPEPADESVLAFLEDVLEKARAGKYSAVAAAFVYRDGSTGSGYSHQHNIPTMVGSVEALKGKLVRDMIE
jgi:hypothetical protein